MACGRHRLARRLLGDKKEDTEGVQAFFAHPRLSMGKKKGFSVNSVSRMSEANGR